MYVNFIHRHIKLNPDVIAGDCMWTLWKFLRAKKCRLLTHALSWCGMFDEKRCKIEWKIVFYFTFHFVRRSLHSHLLLDDLKTPPPPVCRRNWEHMQNLTFEEISNVTSNVSVMSHTSEELQTLPVIQIHHHYSGWTLKLKTRLRKQKDNRDKEWKSHFRVKFTFLCLYYQQANERTMIIFYIAVLSLFPSCMSSSDVFFWLLPPPVFLLLSGIVVDIWLSSVEWAEEIYNLNRIDFNKLFVLYSHLSALQNLNITCFFAFSYSHFA